MNTKDDFNRTYRRWRGRRFPSGGNEVESADLRLDLLLIDEGLIGFVHGAVLGGRPYRVSASVDLEEVLIDLETTRERALRMRETKQGEARTVVENVLEYNELALSMHRGFLARLLTDPSAPRRAKVLWAFERLLVRLDKKVWRFWLLHYRGRRPR
jgi:hypothetical protein